ncbi:MAG: HD domain-containing protein [Spirochaetales bacterium]|nr:HD domain-containing protein [Spirochaetales bacterium]
MKQSTNKVLTKEEGMVFTAIEFAAKAHNGQFRKGTHIPYIFHPMEVAKILIEYNYPQDVVIAGLLHDTIEDTSVTVETIQKTFNKNIAQLVVGASEKNKQDTWDNRKKETLSTLKTAPHDLLALACADKLNNIIAIKRDYEEFGDKLWERFNQPGEKQQWYYTSLSDLFRERMKEFDTFPMAHEFIKTVKEVFNHNK